MSTNADANTPTQTRKSDRRWLQSVIAASAEPLPSFPWMRGVRRKPQSLFDATPAPVKPQRVTLAAR
ncbi:MAG: hypothetical protein V4712_15890 [Pseudomonadota bacterium]